MKILKKYKVLIVFLLLSVLTFTSATAVYAKTKTYPILLKVGDFFILYAYPAPPYLDEHDRLMVPLRSVCQDLIGGKVSFDSKTKSTSIVFDGKNVEFSVGSKTAKANGKTIQMDTVPALKDGHIFVPIKLLIDNLGLKSSWNSEYGFVHIDDERIRKSKIYTQMYWDHIPDYGMTRYMGVGVDPKWYRQDAFAPIGAKVTKVEDKKGSEKWHVEAKLKNVTGKNIPEGDTDCQIQFFTRTYLDEPYISHTGWSPDLSGTWQYGPFHSVKKDEIIENREQVKYRNRGINCGGAKKDLSKKSFRVEFIVMIGAAKK